MLRHLYYFTHLTIPFSFARRHLHGDPGGWLPRPAEPSAGGWLVDLHATGDGVASPIATQRAVVVVDAPRPSTDTEWGRPIGWRSASAPTLFPVLDGDLELGYVSEDLCQLSLMATYRPPLSIIGDVADRLVGHRIAEAVARRFVEDIAARVLEDQRSVRSR